MTADVTKPTLLLSACGGISQLMRELWPDEGHCLSQPRSQKRLDPRDHYKRTVPKGR